VIAATLALALLPAGCGNTAPTRDSAAMQSAAVTLPPEGGFDYQLGGAYQPPDGVRTVTRDRTASTAAGLYNICYVNAYQTQQNELTWWRNNHRNLLLHAGGHEVRDPGWPEVLLDTSTTAKRAALARIVGGWIDKCAADGFQSVEPDNLDSWTRSRHQLTSADNLAFASLLITRAHADGLAIAQKNTAERSARGAKLGFDFAVAEECAVYDECGSYTAAYHQHVLEIEYTDNGRRTFPAACRAAAGARPVILRDRDLVAAGKVGYAYKSC
jgi:hypothetical protein